MFSDQKVETLPGGSQVIVLFCRREDIVLLHATVATAHSEALNGDVNSNVLITSPPAPPPRAWTPTHRVGCISYCVVKVHVSLMSCKKMMMSNRV